MTTQQSKFVFADREALRQLARDINIQAGVEADLTTTGDAARDLMLSDGVEPDANLFSSDIVCARYGEQES